MASKVIIYSVLPRLWGNDTLNPKANGTLIENGSGKLSAWDTEALSYVKGLGCTHIWFIGLLEHATSTAFQGIKADSSDIVKGIAGSPYAVKDYYDIAPELADCVDSRLREFEALLERCHNVGLKVLMDFIPNHVARSYYSDVSPALSFGLEDDTSIHFSPNNNFYYFPNEPLTLPVFNAQYTEFPARVTGNDSFTASPNATDWYETVKLNYGIDYLSGSSCFDPIPNTWHKMLHILEYWANKGIDGFRCDMAEMVPPEFWRWALSQLKSKYQLIFLAEIYQPHRYLDYLHSGFDYLYDKVGVYDTFKGIVQGTLSADEFDRVRNALGENQKQMCYFLENHDEQRFASSFFSSEVRAVYPALTSLILSGDNPYLHYFGGEIGESGMDSEGFSGCDGRTSIFDYWAIDSIRRLRADYSGKYLTELEQQILRFHTEVLSLSNSNRVLREGQYYGLNYMQGEGYNRHRILSYVRYIYEEAFVLVVTNFSREKQTADIFMDLSLFDFIGLQDNVALKSIDLLNGEKMITTLSHRVSYRFDLESYGVKVVQFIRV